jgi:hypothetical protein
VPNLLVRTQGANSTDVQHKTVAWPLSDLKGISAWSWEFKHNCVKLYPGISDMELRSFTRWIVDPAMRALRNFISGNIWALPEVLRVVASIDEDGMLTIRTIIESEDRTARYRVYEVEKRIVEAFPSVVFNFSVINLRNFQGADVEMFSEDFGDILYDKTLADSNNEVPIYVSDPGRNVVSCYYATNAINYTMSDVLFSCPRCHQYLTNESNENRSWTKTSAFTNDTISDVLFEYYPS